MKGTVMNLVNFAVFTICAVIFSLVFGIALRCYQESIMTGLDFGEIFEDRLMRMLGLL